MSSQLALIFYSAKNMQNTNILLYYPNNKIKNFFRLLAFVNILFICIVFTNGQMVMVEIKLQRVHYVGRIGSLLVKNFVLCLEA